METKSTMNNQNNTGKEEQNWEASHFLIAKLTNQDSVVLA